MVGVKLAKSFGFIGQCGLSVFNIPAVFYYRLGSWFQRQHIFRAEGGRQDFQFYKFRSMYSHLSIGHDFGGGKQKN